MIIYNIAVKTNLLTIYTNVHKLLMCGTTNASFHAFTFCFEKAPACTP